MKGIYAYVDTMDNSVVYVGKDSHIGENRRHKQHFQQSNYDGQPINRVLQNNPDRYTYQVLAFDVKDQETLNNLEIMYIANLKPRFNFTDGGEGTNGYKHTEEFKQNLSEIRTKKNARVTKKGYDREKQIYVLRYDKTNLIHSYDKKSLGKLAKQINKNGGIMEKSKPIVDLF